MVRLAENMATQPSLAGAWAELGKINKHDTRAGVAELVLGDGHVRAVDYYFILFYFISFYY